MDDDIVLEYIAAQKRIQEVRDERSAKIIRHLDAHKPKHVRASYLKSLRPSHA